MHLIPVFSRICCISILLILKSGVFVLVSIHCMFISNSPTGGNKEYQSVYLSRLNALLHTYYRLHRKITLGSFNTGPFFATLIDGTVT